MKGLTPMAACLAALAVTEAAAPDSEFRLWRGKAPGALGDNDADIPTLTPFFPAAENTTGAAVIICPGGSYVCHAPHEGGHYARYLNELGIAAFVLKYRLGPAGYRHPVMLNDAARAVRLVRAKAAEWNLDPNRIGIMGSSAGGHVASTLLTHFDDGKADDPDPVERESSRPDLGVLCYAVITMGKFSHAGCRNNLLGANPSTALIEEVSNELKVSPRTPPCFIWHTEEDGAVPVENSLHFAAALRGKGVPFDLHVYQKGGHGIGLGSGEWNPAKRHPWTADLAYWLKAMDFSD